jgi:hypothetical protein
VSQVGIVWHVGRGRRVVSITRRVVVVGVGVCGGSISCGTIWDSGRFRDSVGAIIGILPGW